jgi:hypothetical protein
LSTKTEPLQWNLKWWEAHHHHTHTHTIFTPNKFPFVFAALHKQAERASVHPLLFLSDVKEKKKSQEKKKRQPTQVKKKRKPQENIEGKGKRPNHF